MQASARRPSWRSPRSGRRPKHPRCKRLYIELILSADDRGSGASACQPVRVENVPQKISDYAIVIGRLYWQTLDCKSLMTSDWPLELISRERHVGEARQQQERK